MLNTIRTTPIVPGATCGQVKIYAGAQRALIGRFARRRLPGLARSGTQTVRFGVASASHLGDQVTGK
jgi:hypothetical protein